MLGEAFYKQFKDDYMLKCTDIDVNENWLSYLDFREFEAYSKDVTSFIPIDFLRVFSDNRYSYWAVLSIM